jgi:hypothetical protein
LGEGHANIHLLYYKFEISEWLKYSENVLNNIWSTFVRVYTLWWVKLKISEQDGTYKAWGIRIGLNIY